jgi:hypothetical protein
MKRGTESGPEVVAQSYLAALASRDWDAAADLVDEGMVGRAIAPFRGVAGNEGGNASSGRRDHLESDISNLFRGVASRAELETMSPSEAFARLLAGFGARTYEAARPRQPVRIVGSVVKSGVAHVVYYSKWESEDDSASLPRVLVLRQSLNGWAVLPTAEALEPSPETLFMDPFRIDW